MADWEALYHELLIMILKKISLIEDVVAFGMVCKSWHAAAAINKRHLLPLTPWLMLPIAEAKADRQIFSLAKHDMLAMNLYIPGMYNKKCIGLNYRWILIMSFEGGMNLVDPLSRAQIQLPPWQTIAEDTIHDRVPYHAFLRKAALSANPSQSPSDFVLMIIYGYEDILRYWRPGDRRWTNAGAATGFNDLIYHEDRFYAITCTGAVWSWTDLGPRQSPILARYVTRMGWRSTTSCHVTPYVVARSAGPRSMFVVVCFRDKLEFNEESYGWREDRDGWKVNHLKMWFQVYELDSRNGWCSEIKSLGDRAFFVGRRTSAALENASEYAGVKPNCIYFTNDSSFRWEKEVGCYNLHDGQIMHFSVDRSLGRHFWFVPSL